LKGTARVGEDRRGGSIVSNCPACQAPAPDIARFCPRCGKRLPDKPRKWGLAVGLLVVVPLSFLAAVGVLAARFVPDLFKQEARTKQPEARANLLAIHARVQVFEQEKGVKPRTFKEMGYSPAYGRRVYTLIYRQDILDGDGGRRLIPASLATDPSILDAEAVAVGNLDVDPTLDVWAIDAKGTVDHVQDDAAR
jgi:hypothetical protein